MSDLERLLESVAEECSETSADYAAIGPILKRRFLPLLMAGQAMRDDYGQTLDADPCAAWDVAKRKALEP